MADNQSTLNHKKVNHILAGETRFTLRKNSDKNDSMDINYKGDQKLDILYNWEQKQAESPPHGGFIEK